MSITHEQVKHIAKLAQLELTGEEIKKYSHELSAILKYIDTLKQLDTENVQIDRGYCPIDYLREDKIIPSLSQNEVLKIVPEHEKGYIKVPKIIE